MKYNLRWILEKVDNKENLEYIFFWGHTSTGVINKTIFSQWFPSPFVVDDVVYPTAEHWMMAAKARTFNDQQALYSILMNNSPQAAKGYGRKVKNFDPQIWSEKCFNVVVSGNIHKFSQNPAMKDFLLSTGNKVIVEASPYDLIWGVGLPEHSQSIENPYDWNGQNLLGFALMEVRDILKPKENE